MGRRINVQHRYLTVPYNDKGVQEYNNGVEESENLYTVELPENEFLALVSSFGLINKECGLMIDDYESETIAGKHLKKCRSIIANVQESIPVFTKALETAIEYKTLLGLDF
jgi:hypothetical protein